MPVHVDYVAQASREQLGALVIRYGETRLEMMKNN